MKLTHTPQSEKMRVGVGTPLGRAFVSIARVKLYFNTIYMAVCGPSSCVSMAGGRGGHCLLKIKKEGKERRGEGSSRGSRRGQKPHKKLFRMFRILKKNHPRTRKIMYKKDKSTYIKL